MPTYYRLSPAGNHAPADQIQDDSPSVGHRQPLSCKPACSYLFFWLPCPPIIPWDQLGPMPMPISYLHANLLSLVPSCLFPSWTCLKFFLASLVRPVPASYILYLFFPLLSLVWAPVSLIQTFSPSYSLVTPRAHLFSTVPILFEICAHLLSLLHTC